MCLAVVVAAWLATAGHTHRPAPAARPPVGAHEPHQDGLAAGLNRAERIIDEPAGPPNRVARAALYEQLATGVLERMPGPRRRHTLSGVDPQARARLHANLAAATALTALAEHRTHLPPWQIIAPPAPAALLRFFHGAQIRYRVPWQYLAAIELVESRFGRIRGPSSAGAEGPMQFLPATWAEYGRGSIDDPRAAIFAAARLLAANGAPADMAGALYHYNNSHSYVAAVQAYARAMQRNPHTYDDYYNWQVLYAYDHRTVLLPVGFPRTRPVPLDHLLSGGLPSPIR